MGLAKDLRKAQRVWLQLVLIPIIFIASTSLVRSEDVTTTIYIVRHAEKLNTTDDSPISDKGKERAQELAHVLQDAGLSYIFVSQRLRTQQTAAPTAKATDIDPEQVGRSEDIVESILNKHVGGHVLVVGHSDTVGSIAAGLGADGVPVLGSDQYDRLFLVHRVGSEAHVHVLRFGELTD